MIEFRDEILRLVRDPAYRPAKPKAIARQLGLDGDAAELLKKSVKKLVKAGELAYGASHLVLPVAALRLSAADAAAVSPPPQGRSATVRGVFRRNVAGFGFVRPDGTRPSQGRDADVYIPASEAGDAASGDSVRVRVSGKRGRLGKPEGRIVEVVERAANRFVGVYFEQVGMGLVRVDGNLFAQPIYVGDPGAKGVRTDDKVVLEMVRFPSHQRDGEGVVVEVLGARHAPGVDTLSIIREFDLPGDFADDALEEARLQAEQFDETIGPTPLGAERKDLTAEAIVTIDPAAARDFDDAISLARLDNGHWRLGVHIADVSHFVPPRSALDREARERATSVYLPDRVIPMLPEALSNHLASLQPDRVRYALTAEIEFAPDGARVAVDVYKSAIRSCRRFTYEEVDQWLNGRGLTAPRPRAAHRADAAAPATEPLPPALDGLLGTMFELAMILRQRRLQRGALELNMPEIAIDLDADGRMCGAHVEESTESHQIIEEFMLAANEAVAELLATRGLAFLRRVHGAPDPRKLKALTAFVKELQIPAESLENRFALQQLLREVHGDPREPAVNFAVLRAMQRAVYSPEAEGHYALASDHYCHFTSPIRRYPDLTVHRLVEALLAQRPPQQDLPHLVALGDHCSQREQRAAAAERELTKVKLLNFLATRVGLPMDGVITGVESYGLFVTGADIPAEGFVHLGSIADDYYRYDRDGHAIVGLRERNAYRLGDRVRVAVAAVDVDRRELDFRLLGRTADDGPRPRPRRDEQPHRGGPAAGRGNRPVGRQDRAPRPAAPRPKKKRRRP